MPDATGTDHSGELSDRLQSLSIDLYSKESLVEWDHRGMWYHGSPFMVTSVRAGSTITQDRRLAEVFSHKPSVVTISSHEGCETIHHDGTLAGLLYRIAEEIGPDDIRPVPHTSMEPGREWLTHRDLKAEFVGPTKVDPAELLTEREVQELQERFRRDHVAA